MDADPAAEAPRLGFGLTFENLADRPGLVRLDRAFLEHLAAEDAQDTIAVATPGADWTVRPSPREVTVTDGAPDHPRALIEAAPDPLLRWLWGRAPQDAVQITGDPAWAAYLREMLAAATV